MMKLSDDWQKYIDEYDLEYWVDQWGEGSTAKLYYIHPSEDVVEQIRSESDIPIISQKEADMLQAYNQARHAKISERLLQDVDTENQEAVGFTIEFKELKFTKFDPKNIKDLK